MFKELGQKSLNTFPSLIITRFSFFFLNLNAHLQHTDNSQSGLKEAVYDKKH